MSVSPSPEIFVAALVFVRAKFRSDLLAIRHFDRWLFFRAILLEVVRGSLSALS